MKFDINMSDIACFDDGNNWRYNGIIKINDTEINVPSGTINITALVIAEIESKLGRELTVSEFNFVDDNVYDVADFDFEAV